MSLKVQKLCEALHRDRNLFEGMIVIAFGKDGTTHVDFGGAPEANVRMFLHGISVLCSVAAGVPIEPLVKKPEPSIIVSGSGS